MFTNISRTDDYPKTLIVRNHPGGMIWQIYHVQKLVEAERLASTAYKNGFYAVSLEDYKPNLEETWPDWRETDGGKLIIQ